MNMGVAPVCLPAGFLQADHLHFHLEKKYNVCPKDH